MESFLGAPRGTMRHHFTKSAAPTADHRTIPDMYSVHAFRVDTSYLSAGSSYDK